MALVADPDGDLERNRDDANPRRGDITDDYTGGGTSGGGWNPDLGVWLEPGRTIDDPSSLDTASGLSDRLGVDVRKVSGDETTWVVGDTIIGTGSSGRNRVIDMAEAGEFTDPDTGGTPDNDVSDSDRYGSSSPIGSGNVDVGVDPDTGRATENIGGEGSGGATTTPEAEDDVPVVSVPSIGVGGAGSVLNEVENRIEDATGGTAFGDPNVVENIGSGDAIREIADDPRNWAAENQTDLRLIATVLGIVGSAVTVGAYLLGRDD